MPLRHFLRDDDLTHEEQALVLARAVRIKAAPFTDRTLVGPEVVAVLFDKQTLRTQLSFSAAIAHLGGYPMVVDGKLAQVGVRESIADVARVMGREAVAIVWRTYGQDRIEEMAAYARAGHQRAHRRLPPVPDPRRPDDRPGAPGRASREDPRLPR